jgi:glycosyltransferase involved in cell wall biosynthesis
MPKLLQINSCVALYSTGQLVENIGKVAISKGWESYVAYGRAARSSQSELIKIGNNRDNILHGMETRLFDGHGLGSKNATRKLIKQINEIKPDIIQLHNIHGYYLNYEIFFKYLSETNIPVVWSLHDCWTMTGHCSHFTLVGCYKWKTECYNCPLKSSYPASWSDKSRRNYRLKKAVFTTLNNVTMISASKWLGGVIKESYLSKYPLKIIPNGIDTDVFLPRTNTNEVKRKYGLENKFVIMGVGSIWGAEKGLYDYYKLSEILTDNYVIVLVGMSEKQIKNLPKRIIGISRTDSVEELSQLYSVADVITSLSYLEAFGLTPIEGFACGTPAIVYNCTSTPELITPETGLIVEPGNIDEVVSAIETIKKRGKLYYSENCRKQAIATYKKEDRFGDYIKLYEEILKRK